MKIFEIIFTTGKKLTVACSLKSEATTKAIELKLMTKDDCFDIEDIVEVDLSSLST